MGSVYGPHETRRVQQHCPLSLESRDPTKIAAIAILREVQLQQFLQFRGAHHEPPGDIRTSAWLKSEYQSQPDINKYTYIYHTHMSPKATESQTVSLFQFT